MKKLLIIALLIVGCAPVFSDLQSAKTVGQGNIELTPSYSKIYYYGCKGDNFCSEIEYDSTVQTQYGIQFAYGLNDRLDIRSRIEKIKVEVDHDELFGHSITTFGFGLKYSIIKDKFSVYVPISYINSESGNTFKLIEPTALFTIAMGQYTEFYPSLKLLIPLFEDEGDINRVFNLGLGISNNWDKWILHPEIGYLQIVDAEFYNEYVHYSFGLTIYPNIFKD